MAGIGPAGRAFIRQLKAKARSRDAPKACRTSFTARQAIASRSLNRVQWGQAPRKDRVASRKSGWACNAVRPLQSINSSFRDHHRLGAVRGAARLFRFSDEQQE